MKKQNMKISKSAKTFIRREKAKIRKSGVPFEEQKKLVEKLYQGVGAGKTS